MKSFSMAMGISRPGFQLLTLASRTSNSDPPLVADSPCLLPNQLAIYLERYLPLAVISLVVLVVSSIRQVQAHQSDSYMSLPMSHTRSGRSNRRESAVWATLSPEPHHSPLPSPSEEVIDAQNLRVPTFRNGYGGGKLPTTPTFQAISPSAAQLDSPMLFASRTGQGIDTQNDEGYGGEEEGVAAILPEAQYARWSRSLSRSGRHDSDSLPRPSGLSRLDKRDLRWRISWSFPFRNRWRRITFGVPPTIERFIRGTFLDHDRTGEKTVLSEFCRDFLAVLWIPVGTFILIVYYMFK